MSPEAN